MVAHKKSLSFPHDQLEAAEAIGLVVGETNRSRIIQHILCEGMRKYESIPEVKLSIELQASRESIREANKNERLDKETKAQTGGKGK